jgi:LytR cell envelope-related transcriptional attenuator
VKTHDELWRWIWEEERVADGDPLAEVEEGSAPPTTPPPPAIRAEDVWEWLSRDDPLLEPDPLGDIPQAPVLTVAPPEPERVVTSAPEQLFEPEPEPEVEPAPGGEPEPEAPPVVLDGTRAGFWAGRVRYLAVLLLAVAVGAVAPQVLPASVPERKSSAGPPAPPEQTVVAWSVLDERGLAFVAAVAAGAGPPVTVAVPADLTINLPGQGLGTVRDAAIEGRDGPLAVALENLLGVPIDAPVAMTTEDLAAAVDAIGGIEVADQPMNGGAVVVYLTAPEAGEVPDERFLRWQDVLDGLLEAMAARPDSAGVFPDRVAGVLARGSPERADLLALPVIELGAGLLRPDQKGIGALVAERFIPHAGDAIRLVVLNGVGKPGIGEEVARILVPNGFRLMSSENANRFDYKVTRIVATSEEDLPAAERTRELLGVGQIMLGAQPQLADVIVVVGADFPGGR